MRTEPGRITEIDYVFGELLLDSGKPLKFELPWDKGFREGTRVVVTFGAKNQVTSVDLDLALIGMTAAESSSLSNIQARFDAIMAEKGKLTTEQRELFDSVIEAHRDSMGKAARKLRDRIERALAGDTLPLTDEDPWAAAAREDLEKLGARSAWIDLLSLSGDGSKPTKKWLTAAKADLEKIGSAKFMQTVKRWFALVAPREVNRNSDNWYAPAMADANSDALKNLVWACSTIDNEQIAVAIGDLAVRCFTKIRGVGALSTKAGNACIYVLSQLPGLRAVAQLSRLGSRVRYKQALALVEKAKLECATRAGVSPIDLEELSLPTFGLDVEGRARIEVGEHTAELAIVEDKATLTFFDGKKKLKTAPKSEEVTELKASQKELAALLPTVRARLERWMFEPRSWSLADLRTRYLDHPLVARLARRLIYITGKTSVVFFDGRPIDRTGKEVALADDAQLTLWHPLERSAKEIAEWRKFLASIDVTQPLKQVDRETYRAEDKPRFTGKLLRQHQFAALLRERGWSYSLMGGFDGHNSPTKHIAHYDVTVSLDLEVPENTQTSGSGIYVQVMLQGIRFARGRAIKPADVPERCFSEVMRDVDLFVTGSLVAE